jgi:hypothetical protein
MDKQLQYEAALRQIAAIVTTALSAPEASPERVRSIGAAPDAVAQVRVCIPKRLKPELVAEAAARAVEINPLNQPNVLRMGGDRVDRDRIAVLTRKYWGRRGVRLTVRFMDTPSSELRSKILSHMNAWNATANVQFVETDVDGQVRIARESGQGYWSYLGTDVLSIPANEQTMNLDSFSLSTPESEFYRVVRHETGHTLGFPHEHMRREIVELIDPEKAIEYFGETQGWSPDEVRAQVLTPIDEASIFATPGSDTRSIMCYQLPGKIMRNNAPILGGTDIDPLDYAFAGSIYPKS